MNHTPLLLIDPRTVVFQDAGVDEESRFVYSERVIPSLARLRAEGPFAFVLVCPERGVGTPGHALESFEKGRSNLIGTLRGQGIDFDREVWDFSLQEDKSPSALPSGALLDWARSERYDLARSVLVTSDEAMLPLAQELGCEVVFYGSREGVLLSSTNWNDIVCFLLGDGKHTCRTASIERKTKETQIRLTVNLDGTGKGRLETGIGFFDHMLDQIVRHTNFDVDLHAHGDLEVDEHHTVEDVAIVLGTAVLKALGDKRGISRYGCELLPMDDVQAKVAIDFSGRPDFIWQCPFSRQYIGTFPTEMVEHFFKSFSDAAQCNLHMQVGEGNTHHQAEALFKGFAHAVRQAVRRYYWSDELPSTKGSL